jgi:hypothetical protein
MQYVSSKPSLLITLYANTANAYRVKNKLDAALQYAEKCLLVAKTAIDADVDSLPCAHLTMCCVLSQMESHEVVNEHPCKIHKELFLHIVKRIYSIFLTAQHIYIYNSYICDLHYKIL